MIVAAISVFSELIMTVTILYALPMLGGLPHKIKPVNLVLALTFVLVVSIVFDITFYFQNAALQFIFLVLNYFKFAAAAIIYYKRCSIKIICLTFILHTICAICKIGVSLVIPMNQYSMTYLSELSLLSIRLILMLLIVLFKKRGERNYHSSILVVLPSYIYVLILINIFLADGLMEAANYETTDIITKNLMIKVLALLLSICVFATLIALVSGVWSKKYYSDINAILERQVETQIKYYENREKTYTAIRRFKHDYINHINCIRSMLISERYSQAAEYLSSISDMFPTDNFLFDTGNFVSDAILSDKQESVKDENIVIKFSGAVPASINGTAFALFSEMLSITLLKQAARLTEKRRYISAAASVTATLS